jgi:hypothetical protein
MLGAEIPDGLLFGLLPVALAFIVTLIAWIVRELGRISVANARTEARYEDHERRIGNLERSRGARTWSDSGDK